MGVQNFPHPPLAAGRLAARLLSRHSPHEIAEAIEVLVELLDLLGGDPDVEANGDELDGHGGEDDFTSHNTGPIAGPGCPCSDPDMAVDDKGCDEINQDLEEDSIVCPEYGIDQSRPIDRERPRRV